MFKKLFSITAAGAMAVAGFAAAPSAAQAQGWYDGGYTPVQYRGDRYGRSYYRGDRGYYRGDRGYRGGRGYYRGGRGYYADRGYYGGGRGYYGRGRCRDNGTGGTIIGAIAGGLLGDAAVGRRGDDTAGAIVGAGIGALAGRAIDRNC